MLQQKIIVTVDVSGPIREIPVAVADPTPLIGLLNLLVLLVLVHYHLITVAIVRCLGAAAACSYCSGSVTGVTCQL